MKTKKFFALLAGAAMLVAAVAFTNNVSTTTTDDSQAAALFVTEDNVALAEHGGTCHWFPFMRCFRTGGLPINHFYNKSS